MKGPSTLSLTAISLEKKIVEGLLQLTYLPTRNQLVDILTKILPSY